MPTPENAPRSPGPAAAEPPPEPAPPPPDAPANGAEAGAPEAAHKSKEQGEGKKEKFSSKKGVDTMFRTSYRTNMDLSSLADSKANIMISINGLMVSIILASIAPGMEKNPWLRWPTVILLLGCLTSLVFAVLAARPRVQSRVVTLDEVRKGKANLLFFGNFAHLSRDEFMTGMSELMLDRAAVYDNMVMDIYGLGLVLQKKYRLLRVAYTAFMIGLVAGVVAFIVVFFFFSNPADTVTTVTPIIPAP